MEALRILKASKVERFFSTGQPTDEGVRTARPEQPAGCGQTRLVLRCSHFAERGYSLELPLKSKLPNESARLPQENTRLWITEIPTDGVPVLQVLSSCDDVVDMDYVSITAVGPGECPSGFVNQVVFKGGNAEGGKNIPFANWQVLAPAGLTPDAWTVITPSLFKHLHPLRLPELPPRTFEVMVPGCLAAPAGVKHHARIESFPNVQWSGNYRVVVSEDAMRNRQELQVEGKLSVSWNNHTAESSDWQTLKHFLAWHELAGWMKKVGKSFQGLEKAEFAGLPSTRLSCHPAFHWRDTPTLGVKVESRLFEQKENGLIGHQVELKLEASIGADGEMDLLPLIATTPRCKFLTQPLLRDSRERLEELCIRFGIFLRAQGRASVHLAASSERPVTDWVFSARARDLVEFSVEGRAEDELTTVWIECSTDDEPDAAPTISFRGAVPDFTERQKSVLDHNFYADAHFTGVRLNALLLCRLGAVTTASALPEKGFQLLPPQAWSRGAKAEEKAAVLKW